MTKLLLHLFVAGLVVAFSHHLGWSLWPTVGAVAVGAICAHIVYERFLDGAPGHLGAAAIANDDPLMLAALEEAMRTWPQFVSLYEANPNSALVKYRLRNRAGEIENVWGELLHLSGEEATVYLRTPPVGGSTVAERRMVIPRGEIVDWQVMLADESLRGGFTQQATFRIIERDEGRLHPKLAEQLSRYRSLSEPAG